MATPIVHVSTSDFWTQLSAIGTLAAAAATVGLAVLTYKVVKETTALASSTRDLATETERMADETAKAATATTAVIEETQRDRDLQWRPALSAKQELIASFTGAGEEAVRVTLKNSGGAPPLGCRYLHNHATQWSMTDPVDIPAGDDVALTALFQSDQPPLDFFAPPAHAADQANETLSVIFCRDVLDRRYRFPTAKGPGDHVHAYPLEMAIPTEGFLSPWATPSVIWPL